MNLKLPINTSSILFSVTICSLNVLNYTKMVETGKEENKKIYEEWKTWYSSTGVSCSTVAENFGSILIRSQVFQLRVEINANLMTSRIGDFSSFRKEIQSLTIARRVKTNYWTVKRFIPSSAWKLKTL